MKRTVITAFCVTALFAFSSSVLAATVDIVNYWGLKPGKWSVLQEAGGTSKEGFITINRSSGRIVRKHFYDPGSGWLFEFSNVFTVTSTTFQIISRNDGTDTWIYEPAITFPRLLTVNQSYHYNGILRNQRTNATEVAVMSMDVTQKAFTVHTGTGSFSSCIKLRTYEYSPGKMKMSTQLCAPWRGGLRVWLCKIKDRSNPEQETQESFKAELIQFGDSNPPIP
jgi:hypothetical protein